MRRLSLRCGVAAMSLRRSSADTARDTLAFCMWKVAPITLADVRGRSAIVVRTTHSAWVRPCDAWTTPKACAVRLESSAKR
jgi:hypothetical protein